MGTYATSAEVQARIPYRDIGAPDKPSYIDTAAWITEAEGRLHAALSGVQIEVPITNSYGIQTMKAWTLGYVVGLVRRAYGSTGGDLEEDAAQTALEAFDELLVDIANNASRYQSLLWGGSGSSSTRGFRAYPIDNADGKSISAGDFAPTFTKSDAGDQF